MEQSSFTASSPSADEVPVLILHEFQVGVALALGVLERAVEEDDAWVFDATIHPGVCHVLVEHDTPEHAAIGQLSAWHFLRLGVSLDVNLRPLDSDFALAL